LSLSAISKIFVFSIGDYLLSLTTEEFNPLCERSVLKGIPALAVIVNEHFGEVQLLPQSV